MKKILVIGPSWVGDMVMAQVLFKLLKKQNSVIHVLAPKFTHPLLAMMPEVGRAIVSPFNHGELNLKQRYLLARELAKEKYNQAIVLPNSFKSALIPFFARIPQRTGWRGEMRYFLLNDLRILNKNKLPLMIERFAALAVNDLPVDLSPFWPQFVVSDELLQNTINELNFKPQNRIMALCPGAEYGEAKRWPPEYFAEIAQNKINAGWQVLIIGGNKDAEPAAIINKLSDNKCLDFTGKTSLLQAIVLLSLANIVVTNDTGLMHVAAALDRPLIAIYGSSSPKFTPPLTKKAKIVSLNLPCSPCFERTCPLKHFKCMLDLKPEIVETALDNLEQ